MSEHLWIAGIGIIADYELADSKDIVQEIKKRYSVTDPHDSVFSKIDNMISAVRATKAMSCEELVELLGRTDSPEKFINSDERLLDSYQKIENEIAAIMLDAENSSEKMGKLILYNIKSKYNLRSPLSSKLSQRYPNKLVLVYQKVGNRIKVSARTQSSIDIGKLFQEAVKEFNASAGGHENAAGATVQSTDWEAFKENLISLLE